MSGDSIRIRLTAPPVEGAANQALVRFLAERLGVSRSAVELVSGHAARRKVVAVSSASAEEAVRRLGVASQALGSQALGSQALGSQAPDTQVRPGWGLQRGPHAGLNQLLDRARLLSRRPGAPPLASPSQTRYLPANNRIRGDLRCLRPR
jgi:uncharacterized protein (TIGR00251 family)